MSARCLFPGCPTPGTDTNRAGQLVCTDHRTVVIGSSDDLGNTTQPHANREQEQDT